MEWVCLSSKKYFSQRLCTGQAVASEDVASKHDPDLQAQQLSIPSSHLDWISWLSFFRLFTLSVRRFAWENRGTEGEGNWKVVGRKGEGERP